MKKLLKMFHIHLFSKPIVSQYYSFETRRIIYECRCGKREVVKVYVPFESNRDFPIKTTMLLTNKEFNEILSGERNINENRI